MLKAAARPQGVGVGGGGAGRCRGRRFPSHRGLCPPWNVLWALTHRVLPEGLKGRNHTQGTQGEEGQPQPGEQAFLSLTQTTAQGAEWGRKGTDSVPDAWGWAQVPRVG